jgi:hypothetical protein
MPEQISPGGTFSDLYEAMQNRRVAGNTSQDTAKMEPSQQIAEVEVKKPTSEEVNKKARPAPRKELRTPDPTPLVEDSPRNKVGYYFTQAEIDLIDDIQHELKKKYRLKTSKNDIVRIAVALLATNYQDKKDQAFLVKELKNRLSGIPARKEVSK